MRIYYEYTRKERKCYFNLVQGMRIQRKKLKRNPYRKIKTFVQLHFQIFFLFLICIPFIAFFDTFFAFSFITSCFVLLLFFLFFLNIFRLFRYFFSKRGSLRGEIILDDRGITEVFNFGQTLHYLWKDVDFVINKEGNLYVFFKKKNILLIPRLNLEIEKLFYEKCRIRIITNLHSYRNLFTQFFWNYVVYVFCFLFLFIGAVFWDVYNTLLINHEINLIHASEFVNDYSISSFGKFGIVEKELKNYYRDFIYYKNMYIDNSAETIFSKITPSLLQNQEEEVYAIYNRLPEYIFKSEMAIQRILFLLEEKRAMYSLDKWELDSTYRDLFYRYSLLENNNFYQQNWHYEMDVNFEKMHYVKEALEILLAPDACWYVENDTICICDDAQFERYSELYDLIYEENEGEEGIMKF